MQSYTVIGGGLAGLTAANALAGPNTKVILLEQSTHLGGRARTSHEHGYPINLGPHALYLGGRAAQTFRQWKIPFSGKVPPTSANAYYVRESRLYPMFANLPGLLTTRLFTPREKLEVANLLRLFTAPDAKPDETMAHWLDRHLSALRVREFAATLIRITTFAIELDNLDAGAALTQIAIALRQGVIYVDGGWQTLIDGLADRARSLGVEIRCGEPASALDKTGTVLAVGPEAVEKLTGVHIPKGPALRMATLDLGLAGIPDKTPVTAFALDRPIYLSTHFNSAGKRLVHVAKYLGSTAQDPKTVRAELEEYASLVMPAWNQHTEFVRFLPDLTVAPLMPTANPKRPHADFLHMKNVTVAGDWVGPESMLADAAVASALEAAALLQHQDAAAAA
jgi:phytoene dehydrogenase-like protein